MEDLLTENFTDGVNMKVVKSNFNLCIVILGVVFIYGLLESYQMFTYLNVKQTALQGKPALIIYGYRVFPFMAIGALLLNFITFVIIFQGHRLVMQSLQKADATLFNQGYRRFKKASIFTLCTCLLSIVSTSIWLLLK